MHVTFLGWSLQQGSEKLYKKGLWNETVCKQYPPIITLNFQHFINVLASMTKPPSIQRWDILFTKLALARKQGNIDLLHCTISGLTMISCLLFFPFALYELYHIPMYFTSWFAYFKHKKVCEREEKNKKLFTRPRYSWLTFVQHLNNTDQFTTYRYIPHIKKKLAK